MLLLRDALIEVRWHQSRTSVEICQCLFKESNVGEGWQGSSTYLFSFENISEGNRDRSSCDVIVNGIRVAAVIEQGQGWVEGLPDPSKGPIEPRPWERGLILTQIVSIQSGRTHQAKQNPA